MQDKYDYSSQSKVQGKVQDRQHHFFEYVAEQP
jgi:hypothetical protein